MQCESEIIRRRHNSGLIWLAYALFFLIDPILEPSRALWWKTLLTLAVFLPIYLTCIYTRRETLKLWCIFGIFLVGAVSFPWNTGATTFFVYVAAMLPFSVRSLPLIFSAVAAECAVAYLEARYFHIHLLSPALTTLLAFVVGGSNIFFAQQRRADGKLRMAQEEIEALAAVAERERIARDLHDVLGHTLSVIVLKAELAGRLLDADNDGAKQRARTEMADVEKTARTALAEVREAIGGYRSKGLAAEIDAARRTLEAAGVTLRADAVNADLTGLSAQEETVLALAMREAVTNIVRHARATTCQLRVVKERGRRKLIVEDDGQHTAAQEGNGLRGMRERVEALGGHVELDRSRGTRLLIELPLVSTGAAS